MSKDRKHSFKFIYITYAIAIILTSLVFCITIFIESDFEINFNIKMSIIFIIILIFISVIFIGIIRKKVINIIKDLDCIIDNAINKEEMITGYKENMLSSLENKMFKYVKMTKSNKEDVENERNRVKTLVSDISHQTKTPISNILLYSELLLENKDLDVYSKEIAIDIKTQSERLNFLIQSLIKMSRLESNIIQPSIKKQSLKNVVLSSIQEVYINSQNKKIDISYNCDETITAYFDIKWTIEAIVNILENSIKYTKEQGKIHINVISYEIFKRIDITDNGIGIDETEINNVFKRFYRCKNVKQYNGVGIGLYLTREIISLQGGYIKISSQLNKGTTVSVFLPS